MPQSPRLPPAHRALQPAFSCCLHSRRAPDPKPRRLLGSILVLVAAALCGCGVWRPTTVPMTELRLPAPCTLRPDTLLVMLPGSYARPEEYVSQGFVRAVRERQLAADIVLVDAHLGYYNDKSIVERLRADIVEPARANGYERIWLAGISIGGLGAMLYAQAQPDAITGIVALAPYLGTRETALGIIGMGGLRHWEASGGPIDPNDMDTRLWRWLKPYAEPLASGELAPAARAQLYLGHGRSDRFAYSLDLLAAALPPSHVATTDGGHDWGPWLAQWQRLLDALPLARDASCRAGDSSTPPKEPPI